MSEPRKVAMVTGASKGIGRAISLELAAHGWDVGVNFNRDEAGAEATALGVRELGQHAWVLGADVGYADQVQRMFDAVIENAGAIDLLVNNAAVQTWSSVLDLKEDDWDRTIRTNLKGTFLCTRAAARSMVPRGHGAIINIGSGASQYAFPNLVDYSAAKGGIDNFTRVVAVELGPSGIRVNCVAPGAIEVERTREESPNYAKDWGDAAPMRRVGTPLDVANAVLFLTSEKADFITGQTLFVDGGLFTKPNWVYNDD